VFIAVSDHTCMSICVCIVFLKKMLILWSQRDDIQCSIPCCMLFVDNVVLMDECRTVVNEKLELWRRTLESKDFRLSRFKIEYMKCDFSTTTQQDMDVRLVGQEVPKKDTFHYLRSMLQKNRDIDENVSHRIKISWLK
jgi:hypothetical protein